MTEEVVAMVLAGGSGSRLRLLCMVRAKPAVPFGGIYRIIDFTLSNLMNSDILRVGVLTQYSPLSLTHHIRDGSSWDFAGWRREIKILPPYTGRSNSDWYKGTADAVHQNRSFLKRFSPSNILVVSGDHIYSMIYTDMIRFHVTNNADVTVGTMHVSKKEARRFGVVDVDNKSRITGFYEKVRNPPSTNVSLGIYVFKYEALLEFLDNDYKCTQHSDHDFGKNILPAAVEKRKVFAYPFKGYWRDVGTIQSYWQANMEFIHDNKPFFRKGFELRTNLRGTSKGDLPGAKLLYNAKVTDSLVCRGCLVDGTVEHSILSPGVTVEKGASVIRSVIMHDTVVKKNAKLCGVVCDKQVVVGENSVIGDCNLEKQLNDKFHEILKNTSQTTIGRNAVIPQGIKIGKCCEIFPFVREEDFPGQVVKDNQSVKPAKDEEV